MGYQNQQEELSLSEILQIRRDKLTALCEAGEDPFVKTKYDVDAHSVSIKSNYEAFENKTVSIVIICTRTNQLQHT